MVLVLVNCLQLNKKKSLIKNYMNEQKFTPDEIAKSLRVCAERNRCRECIQYGDALARCVDALKRKAADLIEAQAKRIGELEAELAKLREENRWIPVEERKPKFREPVLVSLRGCAQEGFLLSNGEWYCRYTIEDIETVTHWKPMHRAVRAALWRGCTRSPGCRVCAPMPSSTVPPKPSRS